MRLRTRQKYLGSGKGVYSLFIVLFVINGCSGGGEPARERETVAMDTFVKVTIFDEVLTEAKANVLIDSAIAVIRSVESIATDYSADSEVGRINLAAGTSGVPASSTLVELLTTSLDFSYLSDGKFDVTIGPVVKAWDFLSDDPRPPSSDLLQSLLPLVDFRKISLKENEISLPLKGMRLDFGGIAKGFAVDKSIRVLQQAGVKRAVVDIGGNLGVLGTGTDMLDSTFCEILVRHPRSEGKFFGSFKMGAGGVSTSGDYQRSFVRDGVRYHHILDPSNGQPARGLISVTIVSGNGTSADALSTIVFILGREKGMEFIRQLPGVEGLLIFEQDGKLSFDLSPGLIHSFVRIDD